MEDHNIIAIEMELLHRVEAVCMQLSKEGRDDPLRTYKIVIALLQVAGMQCHGYGIPVKEFVGLVREATGAIWTKE
jgi:hypothetical protein